VTVGQGGNIWKIRRLAGNAQIDASRLRTKFEPKKTLIRYNRMHRYRKPAEVNLAGFSCALYPATVEVSGNRYLLARGP
jgi:hypothetical protein